MKGTHDKMFFMLVLTAIFLCLWGCRHIKNLGNSEKEHLDPNIHPILKTEFEDEKVGISLTRDIDTDGDGISDSSDRCPNTPQRCRVDRYGCPVDSDGDGIADCEDACPTVPGNREMGGCPGTEVVEVIKGKHDKVADHLTTVRPDTGGDDIPEEFPGNLDSIDNLKGKIAIILQDTLIVFKKYTAVIRIANLMLNEKDFLKRPNHEAENNKLIEDTLTLYPVMTVTLKEKNNEKKVRITPINNNSEQAFNPATYSEWSYTIQPRKCGIVNLVVLVSGKVKTEFGDKENDKIVFDKDFTIVSQNRILGFLIKYYLIFIIIAVVCLFILLIKLRPILIKIKKQTKNRNADVIPIIPSGVREKILFISSNPSNTSRLRIDKEAKDIEEGLKRSNKRDSFDFEIKLATTPHDLSRAILDENPRLLHFSGHGETEGIVLENEEGNTQIVTTEAIAGLFSLFGDTIRCVFLNSCYSKSQAKEISKYIPFVIGMSKAVPDDTAIAFATSFYDAIGAGKDIEFAFKFAVSNISLEGLSGEEIPVLLKRSK